MFNNVLAEMSVIMACSDVLPGFHREVGKIKKQNSSGSVPSPGPYELVEPVTILHGRWLFSDKGSFSLMTV